MFDIAFSEMVVIAILALIVLGPNRLPQVARTCGLLYGRLQRYVAGFKADIEREVALDNMKKATAEAQMKLLALQAQLKDQGGEISEVTDLPQLNQVADQPPEGNAK